MPPPGLPIGEVARRAGVRVETIRYYERIGLIPPADRTEGGDRRFDVDGLRRLRLVRRARDLGFEIAEIRELLALTGREAAPCAEVAALTRRHLADLRARIAALRALETALEDLLDACETGARPACPVLDAMSDPDPNLIARRPRASL